MFVSNCKAKEEKKIFNLIQLNGSWFFFHPKNIPWWNFKEDTNCFLFALIFSDFFPLPNNLNFINNVYSRTDKQKVLRPLQSNCININFHDITLMAALPNTLQKAFIFWALSKSFNCLAFYCFREFFSYFLLFL